MFTMKNYLHPPHIQLGFYWPEHDEVRSLRAVLRAVLDRGYCMNPCVTAVRAINGLLPRFSQLATHDLPNGSIEEFRDWTIETAFSSSDWLPVEIRLEPSRPDQVQLDLGLALIQRLSFLKGEPHAIELVASGWAVDIVSNSDPSDVEQADAIEAQRTQKCTRDLFESICRELSPLYGGEFVEWELAPPASLASSDDLSDFNGLYLSDRVVQPPRVYEAIQSLGTWLAMPFVDGVRIYCSGRGSTEASLGMSRLRDLLTEALLVPHPRR